MSLTVDTVRCISQQADVGLVVRTRSAAQRVRIGQADHYVDVEADVIDDLIAVLMDAKAHCDVVRRALKGGDPA